MKSTIRHRAARVSVMAGSIAVAAGAALILPMTGIAGATPPQIGILLSPGDGTGTPLPTSPIPTIIDGNTVEVQVPANTTLANGQSIKIIECGDADGLADDLPTSAAGCDGLTINTGKTINEGSDGSVDKTNYVIHALPLASESPTSTPVCTATSACVLYIGENQNDFTKPFVFSQPFYVSATVGTPTPESPITIALPAAGIIILGAGTAFTIRRRRRANADVAA